VFIYFPLYFRHARGSEGINEAEIESNTDGGFRVFAGEAIFATIGAEFFVRAREASRRD
jgi:hypothetical protein